MPRHIHLRKRHERRGARQILADLLRCSDLDDHDTCLGSSDRYRRQVAHRVDDRREADQVDPLLRWGGRIVERDPELAVMSPEARAVRFREIRRLG